MNLYNIHIKEILGNRYDFSYVLYKYNTLNYHYPTITLSRLLKSKPQYGAAEAGVIRESLDVARYIRITDITENGELSDDIGVTAKTINGKYILNNNDILIARSGNTVGKSYIHKSDRISYPCFFAGYMIRFIVDVEKINPDYFFIYTQLAIFKDWVKATQRITGQPNINAEEYGGLQVPLPPIEIQQKIVDIYTTAHKAKSQKDKEAKKLLDSIDDVVTQYLRIKIPKKSNFSETRYLTPISQLIGERYDPYFHNPYFEKAFAELAKSKYPLKKLGDISVLITSGITPKAGGDAYTDAQSGIAFIRSGDIDINGNINFDELLYIKPEVHNKQMKSSKVYNNDIMIAIVGATIGQVGIYHSDKEANINQAIALVRLKDGYDPEYVKELIKSSIGQLNLDRLKRPVARANINLEEIASILIPIPEKVEIQTAIANEIQNIRVKAETIRNEGAAILENAKERIEKMILG